MSEDPFADLVEAGEVVLASLGGPGPAVERRVGEERVWFQVALTPRRLLVIRSVQSGSSTSWRPANRYVMPRQGLVIARYPRTPRSAARLEFKGTTGHLEVLDIDDPAILPQVEPFLLAWGGPVMGAGEIRVAERDPYAEDPAADTRKLLMVLGAGLLLVVLCCAGGTFAALLRAVLTMVIGA